MHGDLLGLASELIARRGASRLSWQRFGPAYVQDETPFLEATTVRGDAVRALYLLCGATDLSAETGRSDLFAAARAQWDDLVAGKAYLTGGVGSRHRDEAFGERYELPSDHAYCGTCASIASVMWNWRMLLATGDRCLVDLVLLGPPASGSCDKFQAAAPRRAPTT